MLLRRAVASGVQIVSVVGPVETADLPALRAADDRRYAPRCVIELNPDLHSPAFARAATADLVRSLHLEPMGEDLAVVVSELVTNAVRHAEPPLRLEIQADADRVTVAVADGSPGHPAARAADNGAEGGRGMFLVDMLSDATGVRPDPPGKTVWAALSRRR